MKVRLISKTVGMAETEYENKSFDEIIVGIARVSSSRDVNSLFDNPAALLRHCLLNGHWSIFTMANLTFEIQTSRAIGRELLRHKATNFQEFSQRYSGDICIEPVELRKQAEKNRQSSKEVITDEILESVGKESLNTSLLCYDTLISQGIAKETARFYLPECTRTTLIMNGTLREWITTLNVRLHKTAQKECRLVAEAIRDIFIDQCPIISECLYNFANSYSVHILDRLVLEKYGVYKYTIEKLKNAS